MNKSILVDENLLRNQNVIIVGLSGGPDSVCLLHQLKQLQPTYTFQLLAAHMNHGWRTTSNNDELLCKKICSEWNIPLITTTLQTYATGKQNGSLEAYARRARQNFFIDLAQQHNATSIALGHHFDDHIETFFIRLLRGASLHGLTGIAKKQGLYIRPLRDVRKDRIMQYIQTHKLAYCTDETNTNTRFLRNAVRQTILPTIYNTEPRSKITIPHSMTQLKEAQEALQKYTQECIQAITNFNSEYNIAQFLQLPVAIQKNILMHEIIKHKSKLTLSTKLFLEIIRFLNNTQAKTHKIRSDFILHKNKKHFTCFS